MKIHFFLDGICIQFPLKSCAIILQWRAAVSRPITLKLFLKLLSLSALIFFASFNFKSHLFHIWILLVTQHCSQSSLHSLATCLSVVVGRLLLKWSPLPPAWIPGRHGSNIPSECMCQHRPGGVQTLSAALSHNKEDNVSVCIRYRLRVGITASFCQTKIPALK